MKKPVMAVMAAALFFGASAIAIANPHSHLPGRLMEMAKKDPEARFEKRMETFKTRLNLTAEQQKFWPAFEAAMREQIKMRQAMRSDRKAEGEKTASALDKMNRRAERTAKAGAMQKAVADAAKPLYDSLDATQKATFDTMLNKGGKRRGNSAE